MTENKAIKLGFEFDREYSHGGFKTMRYRKGFLEMEFTYQENVLVTQDLFIDEIDWLVLTEEEIKQLDKILNR
jgi:hypothetical protein